MWCCFFWYSGLVWRWMSVFGWLCLVCFWFDWNVWFGLNWLLVVLVVLFGLVLLGYCVLRLWLLVGLVCLFCFCCLVLVVWCVVVFGLLFFYCWYRLFCCLVFCFLGGWCLLLFGVVGLICWFWGCCLLGLLSWVLVFCLVCDWIWWCWWFVV